MITKKLLKAQAFFRHNVQEFVESVGAGKQADGYILNTPIGQLHIWIFDNWIACRFENVPLATIFTKGISNPYTGKWNWHYYSDAATLNNGLTIADFVHAVERLLAYIPTEEDVAEANRHRQMTPTKRVRQE
jgi:hypothetical protein